MILAIDKFGALSVFATVLQAQQDFEAIDVQQEAVEFCDDRGQRYAVVYTCPPHESRLGPFGAIDIGAFKLTAEGVPDKRVVEDVFARAQHVESSSVSAITTLDQLRDVLRRT